MAIMKHASHRDLVTSTMRHDLDQRLYQELQQKLSLNTCKEEWEITECSNTELSISIYGIRQEHVVPVRLV